MLTFTSNSTTLDDLQLKICAPCSSASPSPCIPMGPLLTGQEVSGDPSSPGPCQRCHSISLPNGRVSPGLKTEPAHLVCGRDNHFRERSYSETGERPRVGGQAATSRYKTELCRPFEESGVCKYGDKCQFAHGARELRGLSRHPKYKTELCRTFHTTGICPYGRRCDFIHNAEERRGPPPGPPGRPRLQHSVSFAGFLSGSRSPPSDFSAQGLADWPRPFQGAARELPSPSLGPVPAPQAPEPPSPPAPCSTSSSSAPDSLSDQEGYQSSLSGSESPIQDTARRLPIFSSLSVLDD